MGILSRLGDWVTEGNLLHGVTVETTTQLVSRWNQQISGIGSQKMAASPTPATPSHPTHPSSHLSQHLSFKRMVQRKINSMMCLCAQSLSHVQLFVTPMDSPPGSSVHGILQARILKWGCHFLLKGIFPTQGSNSHLLHWQVDSLPLNHQGSQSRWCRLSKQRSLWPRGKQWLLAMPGNYKNFLLCQLLSPHFPEA